MTHQPRCTPPHLRPPRKVIAWALVRSMIPTHPRMSRLLELRHRLQSHPVSWAVAAPAAQSKKILPPSQWLWTRNTHLLFIRGALTGKDLPLSFLPLVFLKRQGKPTKKQVFISDFSSRPWRKLPPTWVIHMVTRRPAQNTPIHMDFLYGYLKKGTKSVWIGVLWVGLPVAMWITHMGGKFRYGLLEKPLISGNAEGSRNPWVIKLHGRLGCWFVTLQLRDHAFSCRKKQFVSL